MPPGARARTGAAARWAADAGPGAPFDVEAAYREHAGVLYGFAVHALGDRSDAEDLVQEVFARAWRAGPAYDPAQGSVRTWLFAIARNLVLDAHRTRTRRPRTTGAALEVGGAPPVPGPEDAVVERVRVVEALARLSPEHREVVAAVHLQGRTYAELAASSGVPAATLRTRMHYGLRAMRSVLDEVRDDEGGGGPGA